MVGRTGRRDRRGTVLFDAYPGGRGGAQVVLLALAEGLRARGREVRVVVPADGLLVEQLTARGISASVVAPRRALQRYGHATTGWRKARAAVALPGYWWRLSRELRGAAVVHIDDLRGALLAAPAARLAGARVVWHVHAVEAEPALNRFAARLSNAVIVVASTAVPPGVDPGSVHVIPNAVDVPARPRPEPRHELPVVVSISRLHPGKRLEVLLDASRRLLDDGVPHRVVVLGGEQPGLAAYAAELRARAARLGLAATVDFAGSVDDVAAYLEDADVLVQPSAAETAGLAVMEAMAAGVPVVASAVGGHLDLVEPDRTGVLVPVGDAAALAGALRRVLTDAAFRQHLADSARRMIVRSHTRAGVLDLVLAVHDRVAAAAS